MGLSYLSNNHCFDSIDSDFMLQQSSELSQELEKLVCFQDDITLADTSIDPLFHSPSNHPTFISNPQNHTSALAPNSKRQKTTHFSNFDNTQFSYEPMLACSDQFCDGWLADVSFPPVFSCGASDRGRSRRVGGLSVSAQSIAARQRRRRIADKTHELGKLIPGGYKMNTAEMFQSASMYVKFLQAQIDVLTLTNSLEYGNEEQLLQFLASSSVVQEKLYSLEKCLAPRKLVQALSQDLDLLSGHPSVFQQINCLLMTQARQ